MSHARPPDPGVQLKIPNPQNTQQNTQQNNDQNNYQNYQNSKIIFEGTLYKLETGFLKRWQPRHFQLLSTGHLKYYELAPKKQDNTQIPPPPSPPPPLPPHQTSITHSTPKCRFLLIDA